ncbi:MAG: hypothetical protein WC412_03900 [Candidatus Omnitrophota bacterium]
MPNQKRRKDVRCNIVDTEVALEAITKLSSSSPFSDLILWLCFAPLD